MKLMEKTLDLKMILATSFADFIANPEG